MKELSIEQKAKAYDEAVINGSRLWECGEITRESYEYIFPQLKESEDERIMKELLNYLYDVHDDDEERARWISYLEKQGEHAKFLDSIQVGDKVTRNQDGVLVNLSQLKRVAKPAEKFPKYEKGDILTDGKNKYEVLSWDYTETGIAAYYMKGVGCKFSWSCEEVDKKLYIVEQKYADTEKGAKGNNREIPISEPPLTIIHAREVMGIKQDDAWSEEDEKNLNEALSYIKDETLKNFIKDRVQPQNIACYNPYKEVVESIAEMCKHYDKASHSGLRDFYDNVKVKCKDAKEYDSLYPQTTWKPSEEQIIALRWVLNNVPYCKHKEKISGLLDQIKEL